MPRRSNRFAVLRSCADSGAAQPHASNTTKNAYDRQGHKLVSNDKKTPTKTTNTIEQDPTQPETNAGSVTSATSDSDADGDGDGNAGNAEGEEDDDDEHEDPEAFAPSGSAIDTNGAQMGLQYVNSDLPITSAGKKRDYQSSSADEEGSRRPCKLTKFPTRDEPPTNDSDDEDYSGVNNFDSSDEDEPNVERLEEEIIIESEEEHESHRGSPLVPAAPPSLSSDGWSGFDLNGSMFVDDLPFFEEQIERLDSGSLAIEFGAFNASVEDNSDSPPTPPSTVRKVRFVDDVHYASSTSTSTSDANENIFDDLLLQQDSLDPGFRRMIENDGDDDNGQYISDSEYSFLGVDENGDHEDFELEKYGLNDDSPSDCGSSSGYEIDDGETTDEEAIPPATITRPESLLRRESSSSLSEAARLMPAPIRAPTTAKSSAVVPVSRRQGPYLASWIADPTKPIVIIDGTGKRLVTYPAQCPKKVDKLFTSISSSISSSTTTSPRNAFAGLAQAFDDSENDRSDFSSQDFVGPMLGASVNLVMPGLLHGGPGMEYVHGGQVLGPPEAFYPFTSIGADGTVLGEDIEGDDDDDLDLEDFIDFGDDSSDDDEANGDINIDAPNQTDVSFESAARTSIPKEVVSGGSATRRLLDHFDRGVVTAFRRNQHRHQSLLRRQPANASNSGSHGVKHGRHVAVNSLISPLRKRKANGNLNRGFTARRTLSNPHKRNQSTA